ncbi:hypothetical protein [Thermaurantiacus tibetensis]|uniref:hypothetical protein n=1 Tax=Thermaurantiacus tibetensis TaxID=2759035 RepID=UPI00188FB56C|nr:hypothetical protein [Thermaurantiacus tibetensis]
MTAPTPAQPLSAEALAAVRPQVRAMLEAIPAFGKMPAEDRQRLARDLVKVLGYIADPGGIAADNAAAAPPPAAGLSQRDTIRNFRDLTRELPGPAGKDFRAGAAREGTEQFGALVQKVDFPKFVGGLIKNVFEAIVESSMEQMRAFGDLVANVAKSTDAFMRDNIGEGQGRDWLVNRFPDSLALDLSGAGGLAEGAEPPPSPRVVAVGEDPEQALAAASAELGVTPPVTDLSDPAQELRLVTAARLQLARQRQQLLASMVMMGINRIVVTDGSINAKVVFDMRAQDAARVEGRASMLDQRSSANRNRTVAGAGGWGWGAATDNINEQRHMATVGSAVDETSESKAEVKAKLSGEVRVNFKSDYLPLEKMATPGMMSVIQGNSLPFDPNRPAAAPAGG